jgi:hypothetical protein
LSLVDEICSKKLFLDRFLVSDKLVALFRTNPCGHPTLRWRFAVAAAESDRIVSNERRFFRQLAKGFPNCECKKTANFGGFCEALKTLDTSYRIV